MIRGLLTGFRGALTLNGKVIHQSIHSMITIDREDAARIEEARKLYYMEFDVRNDIRWDMLSHGRGRKYEFGDDDAICISDNDSVI